MRHLPLLLFLGLLFPGLLFATAARADAPPRVLVSIAPLHSLVAGLTEGISTPDLLLPPGPSPHDVVMRPSQLRALRNAELVVWVGPALETFLTDALTRKTANVRQVTLDPRMPDGDAHDAPKDDEHGHGEHAHDDHGHDPGLDPHGWLDPLTALGWAETIAAALIATDPARAEDYRRNLSRLADRLRDLDQTLTARLAPLGDRPFIVYHPAYSHLVDRYGLKQLGVVTATPDQSAGARHMKALRDLIDQRGILCLFTEPGVDPRLAKALAGDRALRVAELDPLGAALEPGPDLYFRMMEALSTAMALCLKE